jgi:predicted kinase
VNHVRVLIGAPGAGKTHFCTQHADRLGILLSLDRARAIVGRGEHDQAATPAAVDLVRRQAAEALAAGDTITVDATGAAILDRASWLALAQDHAVPATALVLRVSLATALARNADRTRQVPADVLTAMWTAIDRTTAAELLAEGFRSVIELREH